MSLINKEITREQGILLKVCCSCGANEEATVLCYITEAYEFDETNNMNYPNMKLSSGQTTKWGNFIDISCNKTATETCEVDSAFTWEALLCRHFVYLVQGKDRGFAAAWHYVLVDEDKVDTFEAKISSGNIDVTDYGNVLESGWGKDPPQDIVHKIDSQFGYI